MQVMADWLKYGRSTAGLVTVGAAAASAAVYWATRPKPLESGINLEHQTQTVPNDYPARVSPLCKNGQLVDSAREEVTTVYEAFVRGATVSENGPCLGWRQDGTGPYKWITYNDVLLEAADVGSGLISHGLKADNNTRIAIYAQNSVQYVLMQVACATYSMTFVPLYDTLGPDVTTYIINQAEIEVVLCDNNNRVQKLLEHKSGTEGLRLLICVEQPSPQNLSFAKKCGVQLISFEELKKAGNKSPQVPKPAKPDDLYLICYTSGTTGQPKGAMTTHGNLISVVHGIQLHLQDHTVRTDDVMISFLPLAHSYETLLECFMYMNGARVGFYRGDVKLLMEDIKELKPTLFPCVPRLLNRVYDKVMANVETSTVKSALFNMGLSSKLSEVKRGVVRRDSMWDSLVFKKVQETLGGRCRFICTGSAPISDRVLNFMRVASGAIVLEGYGQTESSAVISLTVVGDGSSGHVGTPLPCNKVRLMDVPDMGYYSADNKGEICVKGPNVFKGYLKQPDKTAETVDEEGWLHTGDIGCWLPNGALKIIDRKKHIFKLAQGEYIAPEKIENIYIRCAAIAQIFVHGDSLKSCLVGIVVPDPDTIDEYVKTKTGKKIWTIPEICSSPEVKQIILKDLTSVGKQAGLNSLEQVRDIHLHPELFSVENGLLTPTFKSKRHTIKDYFSPVIDKMYEHLN